jgi:soluble lytic murein transglycosylase
MRALLALLVLLLPLSAYAADTAGIDAFRDAVKSYEDKDYESAFLHLAAARKKLPVVGDYILYYRALSLDELERDGESLASVGKLLWKYPASPLRQKARALEINTSLRGDWDQAIPLMREYVEDYPGDGVMKFHYAMTLKKRGRDEQADAIFRELFIGAGPFSTRSHEEMTDRDLVSEELHERARNLIGNALYPEAETILRDLLSREDYSPEEETRKDLATALFRQKKYEEAGRLFRELDDLYYAGLSFFRAGKENDFLKTLDDMIERRDELGAELLVALSDGVRRRGDERNALALLDEVIRHFPASTEEALWRKAWTYYCFERFLDAFEMLELLTEEYPSTKYTYWKARTMERMGGDASGVYAELEDTDFYTFLARLKTGPKDPPAASEQNVPSAAFPTERIDVLIAAGLADEAASELAALSRTRTRYSEILAISYKLASIERYRPALLLLDLLPEEMRPDELLYPKAYWGEVERASEEYGMDPFLLLSLMREESRFDPGALSAAGAIGLMQLMPSTAERTARKIDLEINGRESVYEVESNIRLGAHYLDGLLHEFKSVPPALAAYNAGERKVREWLRRGRYDSYDEFIEDIPFKETRNYVKRIVTTYFRYQTAGYPEFDGRAWVL